MKVKALCFFAFSLTNRWWLARGIGKRCVKTPVAMLLNEKLIDGVNRDFHPIHVYLSENVTDIVFYKYVISYVLQI